MANNTVKKMTIAEEKQYIINAKTLKMSEKNFRRHLNHAWVAAGHTSAEYNEEGWVEGWIYTWTKEKERLGIVSLADTFRNAFNREKAAASAAKAEYGFGYGIGYAGTTCKNAVKDITAEVVSTITNTSVYQNTYSGYKAGVDAANEDHVARKMAKAIDELVNEFEG